ncbi:MAG: TspO/MBR family protein [Cyanobacteria bacterium J06621_8]
MNQSNEGKTDGKTFERVVNTVMGVKTEANNSPVKQVSASKELDSQVLLSYILGTLLQIGLIVLAAWGLEKLIATVDNYSAFPDWLGTLLAGMFFALLSIRSRIFSLLNNTRSSKTYDDVVRPKWAPPPLAFPIVWMTIGVLRVISALLVWQAANQQFLVLPLIAFIVHLALGDTWNTIFTVERRLGAALPVVILGPWLSAIIVTVLYWQISPKAGLILAPSCLWLTVAAVLVFSIWQLNDKEPLYPLKLNSFER